MKSGCREIVLQCHSCYYREIELRSRNGALIRWRHDFHNPNQEKKYVPSYLIGRRAGDSLDSVVGDNTKRPATSSEHIEVEQPC